MFQGQNIQVFVRCRPLKPEEKRSVVDVLPDRREIKVAERNSSTSYDTKNFYFDQVFEPNTCQLLVYKTVVSPLIEQVLQGFNCTVFAYGQTGTGKTYTMEGERSEEDLSWEDDPHSGIIPRAISQLFDALKGNDSEFTMRVSFLELYNEDTYDLLSSLDDTSKLKVFDDAKKRGSVIVGGLEEVGVKSKAEIYDILRRGSAKRQTATTLLNACSSRSHTIFSITVHIRESSIEGEELLKTGKLNLVDLAGSENIGRSGAQDKRAREAGNINQSLLTLGRVITALVEKRPHVPYRESKLTRLLQDSLGGKTKTSIIATISPAPLDVEDTLSTLDYASRAKRITNKPEMNQRLTKKALLREYTNEIERLRRDLQATREKNGIYIEEANYREMCQQLSSTNTAIKEKEDRLDALQSELEKSRILFDKFSQQYQETKDKLSRVQEHCEKHKEVIRTQRENEQKLVLQAAALEKVAEDTTNDIYHLHNKKDRIENILHHNQESVEKYYTEFKDDINRLQSLVEIHLNDINNEVSSMNDKLFNISTTIHDDKITVIRDKYDQLIGKAEEQEQEAEILKKEADRRLVLARQHRNDSKELLNQLNREIEDKYTDRMRQITQILVELREKTNDKTVTFRSAIRRESGGCLGKFERLLQREIKEDVRTGSTPQKKTYNIPKCTIQPSTCDSILEDDEPSQELKLDHES